MSPLLNPKQPKKLIINQSGEQLGHFVLSLSILYFLSDRWTFGKGKASLQ
jgi:hypothetical protein